MTFSLFDQIDDEAPAQEALAPGAVLLRRFARSKDEQLLHELGTIIAQAPFRHMVTPGGLHMAVALTNCGDLGWVSDRRGYRYEARDPDTSLPWPPMPNVFSQLAHDAAAAAGYPNFAPNACLMNRYEPGIKLSLHQDKNEVDYTHPIVSVSLGIPAVFLFGGDERTDKTSKTRLAHGDVAVWGGPSRLAFHGIAPLKPAEHRLTGAFRFNLTFRRVSKIL